MSDYTSVLNNFQKVRYAGSDNAITLSSPVKPTQKPQLKSEPESEENIKETPPKKPEENNNTKDTDNISKTQPLAMTQTKGLSLRRPKVSIFPSRLSRDLFLHEDGKPAISKTYQFKYEEEVFPGVVTDKDGRIYLYDRGKGFHRPLKHLHREGDEYSFYHAGFREKLGYKYASNHYIDLGSLEVLQAAIQSSVKGSNIVEITKDNIENDGFMINWMRATSSDKKHRGRYWNDNVWKLNSKRDRNWMKYALPAALAAPLVGSAIGLGIHFANQADIRDDAINLSEDIISDQNNDQLDQNTERLSNLQDRNNQSDRNRSLVMATVIPTAGTAALAGTAYGLKELLYNRKRNAKGEAYEHIIHADESFNDTHVKDPVSAED